MIEKGRATTTNDTYFFFSRFAEDLEMVESAWTRGPAVEPPEAKGQDFSFKCHPGKTVLFLSPSILFLQSVSYQQAGERLGLVSP